MRSKRDRRKKKYRVIIHSSPFLRCMQTSIAIGAGLAQYRGAERASQRSKNHLQAGPSLFRGREGTNGASLSSVKESSTDTLLSPDSAIEADDDGPEFTMEKPDLRIDSFLGEWLTPDYYEKIIAPPSSHVMLANAKNELLRRAERPSSLEEALRSAKSIPGSFPGGWSNPSSPAPEVPKESSTLLNISDLSIQQPKRDRSLSHSSYTERRARSRQRSPSALLSTLPSAPGGYVAPVPTYALSTSEPIPPGYVNHARDVCIDIDFQWDSSRPPQDCGDGGEYGEEWSVMHKRFRRGLQKLVSWYEQTPLPVKRYSKTGTPLSPVFTKSKPPADPKAQPEEDGEDVETVLVLVSHGAGCNALIGALTDQPVLLDVAMASLTIASRKDDTAIERLMKVPPYPVPSNLPIPKPPLSSLYTMSLVASTAHLRSTSHTHTSSLPHLAPYPNRTDNPPLPRISTTYMPPSSTFRARLNSNASSHSTSSIHSAAEPPTFSWSPALNVSRSGVGGISRVQRSATESSTAGTGLWAKREASPSGSPGGWGEGLREESRERSPIGGGRLGLSGLGRSNSGTGLWGAAASTSKLEEVKGKNEGTKAKNGEVGVGSGFWSSPKMETPNGNTVATNGMWGSPVKTEPSSNGIWSSPKKEAESSSRFGLSGLQRKASARGMWGWSPGDDDKPQQQEARKDADNGQQSEDESAMWRWNVGLADNE